MNAVKHGGRIILLTALALVLATLALSLPLYTVKSVQVPYSGETTYTDYYIDFYRRPTSFGDLYPYADWLMTDGIQEVMGPRATVHVLAFDADGIYYLEICLDDGPWIPVPDRPGRPPGTCTIT